MAVRLFVGNLAYSTTEADLRTYFGAVAPPSQVVLPVDRETGRPRGFAFVEFIDRAHAEQAIKQFNGQPYNGRPLAVSEARAREDRGPGGRRGLAAILPDRDRLAAASRRAREDSAVRPVPSTAAAVRRRAAPRAEAGTSDRTPSLSAAAVPRARRRATTSLAARFRLKNTGRSFSLDDVDAADEALPEMDDVATSKPSDELDKDDPET